MVRSPCCDKVGLKKGPWTPEEDQKLLAYIEEHGHGSWRALPIKAGLQRCGKSCRLRWTNYLRPDIKRGKFSLQEEQTIIQLHALLGNRWSAIATHLPNRTDNEIKNYWNTHLRKRLTKQGIDPVTHKSNSGSLVSVNGHSKFAANLNHMAQWESARLEAEARLVRESNIRTSAPPPAPIVTMSPAPSPCLDVLSALQSMWPKPASVVLESPISILSFSEMAAVDDGKRKLLEWKCSGKTLLPIEAGHTASTGTFPWLAESSGGGFAPAFSGMPLGDLNTSEVFDESVNIEGGCFVEVEVGDVREDENKVYWSGILNLAISSSPPSSPPPAFYNY